MLTKPPAITVRYCTNLGCVNLLKDSTVPKDEVLRHLGVAHTAATTKKKRSRPCEAQCSGRTLQFYQHRLFGDLQRRQQCCGSLTFWYGSGSSDPYIWLTYPESGCGCGSGGPKNVRILRIRVRNTGTFTSFFKDKKVIKKSQNIRNKGFSYYFCLMMEGSGAGSGSVILSNPDADPQAQKIGTELMEIAYSCSSTYCISDLAVFHFWGGASGNNFEVIKHLWSNKSSVNEL